MLEMNIGIYPPHINALPSIQLSRLKYVAQWLDKETSFYHKKFRDANVDPSDIKKLSDIKQLPFTTKAEVKAFPNTQIEWSPQLTLRKHTSSGTTGTPTTVSFTDMDLQVMSTLGARSLKLCGCEESMTLQVNYGYGFFTGGLLFNEAARRLGMNILPQGAVPIPKSIETMQRYQPEAWCCTPTYAKRVCYHVKDSDLEVSWHVGSHGAEVWTNETRKLIEEGLGPTYKAFDVFGLCEKGGPFVGHECIAQSGSHIWTDIFYLEVLDENGEDVAVGEVGELVLSHLYPGGFATLRYSTGDKAKLIAEDSCECFASGYPRIQVLGRKVKDEFKVGGSFMIRSDLEDVAVNATRSLRELFGKTVGEFRVELSTHKGTTHVEYHVEISRSLSPDQETDVKNVVRKVSQHTIQRRFPIRLVPIGTFQQSLGKTQLIIDKRTITDQ
jgi:phenylacetate-CoA ligase